MKSREGRLIGTGIGPVIQKVRGKTIEAKESKAQEGGTPGTADIGGVE